MINKTIHYIWLGNSKKDKVSTICINSWFRILKDYEIIEWNETNLKLDELCNNNRFLKECIKRKLWAFASDYLRLYILYNYGGIYLDTDVQVISDFSNYLKFSFFVGMEDEGYIGTGIIGAEKGSPIIKKLLDFYDSDIFKFNIYNNPMIFKKVFNENQGILRNACIANQSVFSPLSLFIEEDFPKVRFDTITIHWYNANWNMSLKGYIFLNTKHINNFLIRYFVSIKKIIGYSLRRLNIKKK